MSRAAVASLFAFGLVGCGAGGFAGIAPGAAGIPAPISLETLAPLPTPRPALIVTPAQITLPTVGATAVVTASEADYAGRTITAGNGCAGVATVAPTSQVADPSGSAEFTLTATVAAATCRATFVDDSGQSGTTAVGIPASSAPSPSALPTPSPTPTPSSKIGPLGITPATIYVAGDAPTAAFLATSPADGGTFTETDTCAGIAMIAASGSAGPSVTYTATYVAPGTCTATVSAPGGTATATIYATSLALSLSNKGRTP